MKSILFHNTKIQISLAVILAKYQFLMLPNNGWQMMDGGLSLYQRQISLRYTENPHRRHFLRYDVIVAQHSFFSAASQKEVSMMQLM